MAGGPARARQAGRSSRFPEAQPGRRPWHSRAPWSRIRRQRIRLPGPDSLGRSPGRRGENIRSSHPSLGLDGEQIFRSSRTRSMSPKEQKTTSRRAAISRAFSINSRGVTHRAAGTVHQSQGARQQLSRPNLTMAWVCPPQISMTVHGRVTTWPRARANRPAESGSRYSSTNFIRLVPLRIQRVRPSVSGIQRPAVPLPHRSC